MLLGFVKDTMKAYFCYRHTLFNIMTSSRLFYLFKVFTCVLLMDVFNRCSLIQLK